MSFTSTNSLIPVRCLVGYMYPLIKIGFPSRASTSGEWLISPSSVEIGCFDSQLKLTR